MSDHKRKRSRPCIALLEWPQNMERDNLLQLVRKASFAGRATVARTLFKTYHMDVNSPLDEGCTALAEAAAGGHAHAVAELLQEPGINVNAVGDAEWNDARTPLICASMRGDAAVVRVLLQADGIAVNQADCFGQTPLLHALESGHTEVARILLGTEEVNVNESNFRGTTALMSAAKHGYVGLVDRLLALHAHANQRDKAGYTALCHASEQGEADVVRQLLKVRGIDLFVSSLRGTALQMAVRNRHAEVETLLYVAETESEEEASDSEYDSEEERKELARKKAAAQRLQKKNRRELEAVRLVVPTAAMSDLPRLRKEGVVKIGLKALAFADQVCKERKAGA